MNPGEPAPLKLLIRCGDHGAGFGGGLLICAAVTGWRVALDRDRPHRRIKESDVEQFCPRRKDPKVF